MEVGKMEKIKVKDVQIAYERHGKGKPLVLIHGYPLDHSIWNDVAGLLKDKYEVIVPDLRGFGDSTTVESFYTIMDMADDLAGLLDHLKAKRVILAGHSMGGYVALAFAKRYPGRVRGLALISSQLPADSDERKLGRYQTAANVNELGVGIVASAMTDKLTSSGNIREFIRPMIERQGKSGIMGALKAMAEREDSTASLAAFKFPIVLIHGQADELIPIERVREAKSILPSAHLVELEAVGHMPMLEAPERVAEALRVLK